MSQIDDFLSSKILQVCFIFTTSFYCYSCWLVLTMIAYNNDKLKFLGKNVKSEPVEVKGLT